MKKDKLETITKLFEKVEIRSIWNKDEEDYYFSVVDVIKALTESGDPSHYWRTLKSRMNKEGNKTVTNCDTFKLKAKDGKMHNTDMLNTEGIFRLIESVPSPKAEPFKLWLAKLGRQEVDNVFDHKPRGLKENIAVAKRGGKIAGNARKNLESELGQTILTQANALTYQYIDDNKQIENK